MVFSSTHGATRAGTSTPHCHHGNHAPNDKIDLADILAILDGFQGLDRCCPTGG